MNELRECTFVPSINPNSVRRNKNLNALSELEGQLLKEAQIGGILSSDGDEGPYERLYKAHKEQELKRKEYEKQK